MKKFSPLILISLCIAIVSSLSYAVPPPGEKKLDIGGKPTTSRPSYFNRLTTGTIQGSQPFALARHHIIPQALLIAFWNALERNGHIHYLSNFLTQMDQDKFSLATGAACGPIPEGWHTQFVDMGVAALGLASGSYLGGAAGGPDLPGFPLLARVYTWLPGNIIEGPEARLRTDDPAHNPNAPLWPMEVHAVNIIGQHHYNVLQRIHDNMAAYVNNANPVVLDQLNRDLTFLMHTYSEAAYFDEKNWEPDPKNPGKYRIKRLASPPPIRRSISRHACSPWPPYSPTSGVSLPARQVLLRD